MFHVKCLLSAAAILFCTSVRSFTISIIFSHFVDDCFKELRQLTNEEYYYPFWLHVADDDADIPHCYEEDPREGYNLADDWNEYDSPF